MADTANHISELDQNLPAVAGPVGEGDDEIRTVKRVLTNDLSGIDAPVYEDADTAGVGGTTPLSSQTLSSFNARITENASDITALQANPVIPLGMISLWYGSVASIPAEWALCDGSVVNTLQTPDLTDRFVQGAGGALNPNDTGGSGSTGSAGAHTHGGSSGSTALTPAQLPDISSNLELRTSTIGGTSPTLAAAGEPAGVFNPGGVRSEGLLGQGHTHSISSDGDHTHTFDPPYYALAYIMYVGPTP